MGADTSAVVGGYHDLVRRDVFDLIPSSGGKLLDIGGGIGATSAALKGEGRADRAVIVDIVKDGFLPEVDATFSGDLNDPAFFAKIEQAEGKFDTILCLDVLEHLIDPWSVVRHAHGLLAPGGVIVASIPNMRFWDMSWTLFAKGRFDLADKGLHDRTHMRWFVRTTAIELMTSSGLRLDRVEGRIPSRRWKAANAVTLGRVRGLFELQYLLRVSNPEA